MMSLAKAVPDGLKNCECKRTTLHKHPLVPYVSEKDPPQERVSALKDQSLKTMIGEVTKLHLSIWHAGMCKALLMHMGTTLDMIKKQGHFKAYKVAQQFYVKQCEVVKQAKATLAELDGATSEGAGNSKKFSRKAKEAMAMADALDPKLQENFLLDLKKAKEA
jgi:hypothetical protein